MLKRLLIGVMWTLAGLAAFAGMIWLMGDRASPTPGFIVYTNNMTSPMAVYELKFTASDATLVERTVAAPVGVDKHFVPWEIDRWPDRLRVRSGKGEEFWVSLPKGKRSITITESKTGTRIFVNL